MTEGKFREFLAEFRTLPMRVLIRRVNSSCIERFRCYRRIDYFARERIRWIVGTIFAVILYSRARAETSFSISSPTRIDPSSIHDSIACTSLCIDAFILEFLRSIIEILFLPAVAIVTFLSRISIRFANQRATNLRIVYVNVVVIKSRERAKNGI